MILDKCIRINKRGPDLVLDQDQKYDVGGLLIRTYGISCILKYIGSYSNLRRDPRIRPKSHVVVSTRIRDNNMYVYDIGSLSYRLAAT